MLTSVFSFSLDNSWVTIFNNVRIKHAIFIMFYENDAQRLFPANLYCKRTIADFKDTMQVVSFE